MFTNGETEMGRLEIKPLLCHQPESRVASSNSTPILRTGSVCLGREPICSWHPSQEHFFQEKSWKYT